MLRIRVVLAAGVVLGVAFAASGTAPGGAPTKAEVAAKGLTCRHVDHGFRPARLSIPDVVARTRRGPGHRTIWYAVPTHSGTGQA